MVKKSNITVTMPVAEYERLTGLEKSFDKILGVLERVISDGKSAIMSEELESLIGEAVLLIRPFF